jgi:hypothetical protein
MKIVAKVKAVEFPYQLKLKMINALMDGVNLTTGAESL